MGVLAATAATAANGMTMTPVPATALGPALALLAAAVFLVGLLGLGAIVLFRWRKPSVPQQSDPTEITDAWAEAGRRIKNSQ